MVVNEVLARVQCRSAAAWRLKQEQTSCTAVEERSPQRSGCPE